MARKTRRERLTELVIDTYRELYANCTVPVSFDWLMQIAPKDEDGKKRIPYDEFFIDEEKYNEIVQRNMKKMRLSLAEKTSFRIEMALGCGPMYTSCAKYKETLNEQEAEQ